MTAFQAEEWGPVILERHRLHVSKLGDHEAAAKFLTEMGELAMDKGLRKQLGRALHLLGELHLRRECPELGTQHLSEAFGCFMGFRFQQPNPSNIIVENESSRFALVYDSQNTELFEEEAEQSRLMMAVSAGQERMSSYFNLLKEAGTCAVAKMKIIEWKLSHAGWWVKKQQHDFLPCSCPAHNRTPLDVLKIQLELRELAENTLMEPSEGDALFGRTDTTDDIRKLRSSFYYS